MRIARAHDVISAQLVVFAGQEPVDFACGNSKRAEHDGHCRRKIFAVARARLEKKMRQRVVSRFPGEIQRVGVTIAQESFNRQGFVEWSAGVFRGLLRKLGDSRVQRSRKLKVGRGDIAGVFRGRGAEFRCVHRE